MDVPQSRVVFDVNRSIAVAREMRKCGFVPATEEGERIQYVSTERELGVLYDEISKDDEPLGKAPKHRFVGVLRFQDKGPFTAIDWVLEYYGDECLPLATKLASALATIFKKTICVRCAHEACRFELVPSRN